MLNLANTKLMVNILVEYNIHYGLGATHCHDWLYGHLHVSYCVPLTAMIGREGFVELLLPGGSHVINGGPSSWWGVRVRVIRTHQHLRNVPCLVQVLVVQSLIALNDGWEVNELCVCVCVCVCVVCVGVCVGGGGSIRYGCLRM